MTVGVNGSLCFLQDRRTDGDWGKVDVGFVDFFEFGEEVGQYKKLGGGMFAQIRE